MEAGPGLMAGKAAGQCFCGFTSKGKPTPLFCKLDDPSLPTRHRQHTHPHLPHLCTRQRGQEMENLEGAPISLWKLESVLFLLVLSS